MIGGPDTTGGQYNRGLHDEPTYEASPRPESFSLTEILSAWMNRGVGHHDSDLQIKTLQAMAEDHRRFKETGSTKMSPEERANLRLLQPVGFNQDVEQLFPFLSDLKVRLNIPEKPTREWMVETFTPEKLRELVAELGEYHTVTPLT